MIFLAEVSAVAGKAMHQETTKSLLAIDENPADRETLHSTENTP